MELQVHASFKIEFRSGATIVTDLDNGVTVASDFTNVLELLRRQGTIKSGTTLILCDPFQRWDVARELPDGSFVLQDLDLDTEREAIINASGATSHVS